MMHQRIIAGAEICRPALIMGVVVAALGGCHPRPDAVPYAPISMREAARIVNENTARITGALRASGHVDGHFTLPDGRSRSYHVNGTLFYLAPTYLRFDLKSFGDRKFLFGSNDTYFWYYDKEADAYRCGRHGDDDELSAQIPIPPHQFIDALGFSPISTGASQADQTQRVQRVVDDYQQILFLVRDEEGTVTLQKEYWLDRYGPRLVRRVVFRDMDGVVELESELDEYELLTPDGPWLPHVMTAGWPKTNAQMRFRITKWRRVEGVGPESVQFTAPRECSAPTP